MTLLPVEQARISYPEPDEFVEYERSWVCQQPDCERAAAHTHEIVRRSHAVGVAEVVAVDGVVLPNQVRLCAWCHHDVTVHHAWIRYVDGEGWAWYRACQSYEAAIYVAEGGNEFWQFIQQPKSGQWFKRIGNLKGA